MAFDDQRSFAPGTLEELLDTLGKVDSGYPELSLGEIIEAVGTRSFGPLLVLAGLIALSPLSGIPGVSTMVGALVVLIAIQLLIGRRHFWLPQWLKRRRVARSTYETALRYARRPARFVDRLLRPRLVALTNGPGLLVIAALCMLIAASMPLFELVPFSATIAGGIFTAFGLSLIAHDGLFGVVALLILGCVAALGAVIL